MTSNEIKQQLLEQAKEMETIHLQYVALKEKMLQTLAIMDKIRVTQIDLEFHNNPTASSEWLEEHKDWREEQKQQYLTVLDRYKEYIPIMDELLAAKIPYVDKSLLRKASRYPSDITSARLARIAKWS